LKGRLDATPVFLTAHQAPAQIFRALVPSPPKPRRTAM